MRKHKDRRACWALCWDTPFQMSQQWDHIERGAERSPTESLWISLFSWKVCVYNFTVHSSMKHLQSQETNRGFLFLFPFLFKRVDNVLAFCFFIVLSTSLNENVDFLVPNRTESTGPFPWACWWWLTLMAQLFMTPLREDRIGRRPKCFQITN